MPAETTVSGNATVYLVIDPKWTDIKGPVEHKRETRLAEDLETLPVWIINAATGELKAGTAELLPLKPKPTCVEYHQTREMASLDIDYKDDEKNSKKTIITGPEEHWDITADIPITSVKQFKYDTATGKVVPNNQAGKPFIGASYKIGDIFTTYGLSNFYKNFSGKLIIRPPFGTKWAAGVGVSADFPWVSIFGAVVRARGDGSGAPDKTSVIWGLSLPLKKYADLAQSAKTAASKATNP